jgi:sugar lactone lactonase YvrE
MKRTLSLSFFFLVLACRLFGQVNTPTPLWTPNPACCLPVTSFGSPGTLSGQFNNPLCLSAAGTVLYVADSNNGRIARMDLNGTPLPSLTASGTLNAPFGVWADQTGYVFVTDRGNNQVLKIDPATDQATPVVLPNPTPNVYAGITTDKNGGIYVVRGIGGPDGSVFKYQETSPGVFSRSASIGGFNIPNSALTSNDGTILYVVDSSNEFVKRYLETPPGSNNYVYDTTVAQPNLITWGNQLAQDPWGNFYLTDTNQRHMVFDKNWNYLYQCQSTATPYPFTYGMTTDSSGNLYRGNQYGFIEKFALCFPTPTVTPTPTITSTSTPAPPPVDCDESYAFPNPATGDKLKIHLQLCKSPDHWTVFVLNTAGQQVMKTTSSGVSGGNDLSLSIQGWAHGVYYYLVEIQDASGTRRLKPIKFAVVR